MSIEGVFESKKHGGAHGQSHESLENSDLDISGPFIVSDSFTKGENTGTETEQIQDGYQREHDTVENIGIVENLTFLPELRAEYLDSYEQEVVENNAEWLKSRCKNLDQVEFDIIHHGNVDESLEFPGISLENKEILHSPSTCSISDSISNNIVTVESTLSMNSDIHISQQEPKFIVHNGERAVNQNAGISVVSIDNPPMATIEADLSNYTNVSEISLDNIIYSNNEDKNKSIMSEVLEDVNIMSGEKDQVFNPDFQHLVSEGLTFGDISGAKQNMKLFVKDGVLTLVPNELETAYLTAGAIDRDSAIVEHDISMENLKSRGAIIQNSSIMAGLIQVENSQIQEPLIINSQGITDSQGNLQPASTQNDNLALATISIQSDKTANSTKILVDTCQGRKLYQLLRSDLTRLLSNNSVSTGPGDQQENTGTTASKPAEQNSSVATVPGGYLLYPVSVQDGSDQTTAANPQIKANTVVTGSDKQMVMCSHAGCGKLFKSVAKLTVHNMTHTGERPFKCSEPGCDWAFTKLYKLKRHEESHQGKKDHVCSFCNKKFTTIYNLKSHLKQHDRPCTELCPVEGCCLKFQTRRDLDKHIKTHEGVEKTYKCPFEGCDKLFLSPHCLGSHPRVHMAEQPDLTCQFEGCGRIFDKLCRLKQHQRAHTGERPYVCHFAGCTWAFSTASKLTRHMTKHTNKRKWVCNECDKAFMRAEHLKGHMITHTGIKPFTCPVQGCGQKFVSKSSVYTHLKKHDNADKEITYHCPMEACDKKYTNKAKLRQHIVKHFPGTLTPEDAAQLDIVPLLKNDDKDSEVHHLLEPTAVSVKTGPDGTMTIDPIEFITTTVDKDGEVTSMPNQFTAELTAELSSMVAAGNSVHLENTSMPNQPKISFRKEISESNGSARTDYHSNMLLSDRAKRRRKLLREKAEGSSLSEDPVEPSVSNASQFPSTNLSSHGITFRDPETGVLYVQTQLLQDDPPHPDLYTDETVLNSELSLPVASDSEITDHSTQLSEFVGSTINLQDLVG